jgi:hypothetical protein
VLAYDPLGVGYAVSLRTLHGVRGWYLTNCRTVTLLPHAYRTEAEARAAVASGRFEPRAQYRRPTVNTDAFGQVNLFNCQGVNL